MNQKGLIPILIIILVAAAALGGYLIYQKQTPSTSSGQAKSTPSPQPKTLINLEGYSDPPVSTYIPESTPSAETVNWKTYTNTKYKISFKYPSHLLIATEENISNTYDIFFARSEVEKEEIKDCLQQMECYSYPFAFKLKEITKPPNKTLQAIIWDDSRADPVNFSSLYIDSLPSLQDRISGVGGLIIYHIYIDRGQTAFYIQIDTEKSLETNVTLVLSTFKFLP